MSPEQIADSLTEAQRERLMGPDNTDCPAGIAAPLIAKDLIEPDPFSDDGWRWSYLGLEVKHILEQRREIVK